MNERETLNEREGDWCFGKEGENGWTKLQVACE